MHLYQVCSNEGPRVQDGLWPGVPSLSHRNTYKNIYKSSSSELTWLRCLKFGMQHCLVVLYQVCSNEGPRFEDGPAAGGPRFKP